MAVNACVCCIATIYKLNTAVHMVPISTTIRRECGYINFNSTVPIVCTLIQFCDCYGTTTYTV